MELTPSPPRKQRTMSDLSDASKPAPKRTKQVRFNPRVLVQEILPLTSMVSKQELFYRQKDYQRFKLTYIRENVTVKQRFAFLRSLPKLQRNIPSAA
jgi:hypothetical protein